MTLPAGSHNRRSACARAVNAAGRLPKRRGRTVDGVPSLCGRPRRSVCPRMVPQKAHPPYAHQTVTRITPRLSATPKTMTEYSPPRGSLPTKELLFRALLIRGSKADPQRVRTAAPDQQSQGQHGHAHTRPKPRTRVRDALRCVRGQTEAVSTRDPIEGEHRALGPNQMGPSPA